MCRAMPFQLACWTEKQVFVNGVAKNKSKCGLSWSVLLSTTSTRHCSFSKHFFVLFLHVERVRKGFWKESLTRTSSAFALKGRSRENFAVDRFYLKHFLQADNELLVRPEMQKKLGVTVFVSEIKRVVNYTEKLSHIIEHRLQGFIVKNIEGESTEPNDLRNIS